MGNISNKDGWIYNDLCKAMDPTEKDWMCSLKKQHKGQHAAYENHNTGYRSSLYKRWPNERFAASEDDVAAAIASITGTLKQRQVPVQMPVPIIDDIDRARGNVAVVTSPDDDFVLVNGHGNLTPNVTGPVMLEVQDDGTMFDHGILTREELVAMLNFERQVQVNLHDRIISLENEQQRQDEIIRKVRAAVEVDDDDG